MSIAAERFAQRHRLTLDEFLRIGEAGILGDDARVELIEGDLIDMAPIGSRHAAVVKRLNYLLTLAAGERAIVSVQDPIALDEHTMPQPDVALLKPRADSYSSAHPRPEDTLLIIEVAETTLAYDVNIKLPLYARAGIPEVWIIDLTSRQITRYRNPSKDAYTSTEPVSLAEVRLIALPGLSIDLSSLPMRENSSGSDP
nr:Uma2 family endonuclease [Gammaproteobacteria bacterium]